ncbi:MAG: hypothetical protein JZD41_09385 [Thermoproteus sp.]|nr:hypothetical protein [Thermoproteus sp.]
MKLDDAVADLKFLVLFPWYGVEEAVEQAAPGSPRYRKLREILRYADDPWKLKAPELVKLAWTHQQAGTHYIQAFTELIEAYKKQTQERTRIMALGYSTLLSVAIMLVVFAAVTSILGQSSYIAALVPLMILPLAHYMQIELTSYDYRWPALAGLAVGPIAYLFTHNALIGLAAGSAAFAALYLPQFTRFVREYMGMRSRILAAFSALIYEPAPEPPKPITALERALLDLWHTAEQAERAFVDAVRGLLGVFLDYISTTVRYGVFFAALMPALYGAVYYMAMFFASQGIQTPPTTVSGPGVVGGGSAPTLNPAAMQGLLAPLAVAFAIITGKMAHSIGLGVSLIWLFLLPLLI